MNDFDFELDHDLDALADLHDEMVQELDETLLRLSCERNVERAFQEAVWEELGGDEADLY